MDQRLFPGPTTPALVQRLARRNAAVLAGALTDAGLADLAPAQALLLPPLGRGERAAEVARRAGVSRQTVAQALAALEASGYVNRRADPADRRAKVVTLTERGRTAVRVIRATGVREQARWGRVLGADRLDELREALTALLDDPAEPRTDD